MRERADRARNREPGARLVASRSPTGPGQTCGGVLARGKTLPSPVRPAGQPPTGPALPEGLAVSLGPVLPPRRAFPLAPPLPLGQAHQPRPEPQARPELRARPACPVRSARATQAARFPLPSVPILPYILRP